MKLWSISFSYRLGLGFHALNNEGAEGGNLMQPRRIDVGKVTYDGISGEIIRRHILENFINICRKDKIPMLPLSEGLHPDRGPLGIRDAARQNGNGTLSNDNLHASVRKAIESCAVIDAGGYLAAWQEKQGYVAEQEYIESSCAGLDGPDTVKRESCFDAGWLISEAPQDHTITQHSTFRDTSGLNNRYSQTMRSNIYGGVIRADLHRIGTDDYWYLQNGKDRLAIKTDDQRKRQKTLIEAIINFIASPTGAKVAGWAPHVFLAEGSILLTSTRIAPFISPIKIDLNDTESPVQPNSEYSNIMKSLGDDNTWVWEFKNAKKLSDSVAAINEKLEGNSDG